MNNIILVSFNICHRTIGLPRPDIDGDGNIIVDHTEMERNDDGVDVSVNGDNKRRRVEDDNGLST